MTKEDRIQAQMEVFERLLADYHGIAPKVAKEWAATLTPKQIDNRLFWRDAGWLAVAAVCGFVCAIGVLAL